MRTSRTHSQVRRLWLSDLPAFKTHLHRLDHETLHDRFGGYAPDSFLDEYAGTCLSDGSVVYGYFDDEIMRAAGELRWNAGQSTAEAALSVESAWRHKEVGTVLFSRVIRAAQNRGVAALSILCLPHNHAMLALARKFEAELHFENDEITGRLIARPHSPLSFWTEYVEDGLSFFEAAYDAQKQLLKRFLHRPGIFSF